MIDSLVKELKSQKRDRTVHLLGNKGIGKTTILKNLKRTLTKEGLMVVHLEFKQESVKEFKSQNDSFQLLFHLMGLQSGDYDQNIQNFEFLLDYQQKQGKKLVLLLDQFEKVVHRQKDMQLVLDFVYLVKQKNLRVVYCLNDPVADHQMRQVSQGLHLKMHDNQVTSSYVRKKINKQIEKQVAQHYLGEDSLKKPFSDQQINMYQQKAGFNYHHL